MFTSLCMFSVTFAASATFIEGATWIPASIIEKYIKETISKANSFEAETIFFIFSIVFTLSPGTILSGLYPVEKSLFHYKLDWFSKIGVHISSVTPGYTVDS